MRFNFVSKVALGVLVARGPLTASAQPVSVPSDARARYEILQLTQTGRGTVEC